MTCPRLRGQTPCPGWEAARTLPWTSWVLTGRCLPSLNPMLKWNSPRNIVNQSIVFSEK